MAAPLWSIPLFIKYSLVFATTMASDWLWAYYITHTAARNTAKATISSGAIIVAGAYVTMSYIDDKYAIIPAVIGGMVGTFLSLKSSK